MCKTFKNVPNCVDFKELDIFGWRRDRENSIDLLVQQLNIISILIILLSLLVFLHSSGGGPSLNFCGDR